MAQLKLEPRKFQVVLDVTETGGKWPDEFVVDVRAIAGVSSSVSKRSNDLGRACELAILTALSRVVGA